MAEPERRGWLSPIGEVFLKVETLTSKLRPGKKPGEGILETNLQDDKVLDELELKLADPRYKDLLEDIEQGRKRASFVPMVDWRGAGILITVVGAAAAIGVEFGLRHAKDVKELIHLVEEHRKKKNQQP